MRFILLGPPGAGKGTQAVRLAERYKVPHVATGDLLRFAVEWETDIGKRAKSYMEAGELVPDEVVLELLRTRLSRDDARELWLSWLKSRGALGVVINAAGPLGSVLYTGELASGRPRSSGRRGIIIG